MKTRVHIVSGFLGAGKTTFINSLLQKSTIAGKSCGVILCEKGETNLIKENKKRKYFYAKSREINPEYLKRVLEESELDVLIIEHNGTSSIGALLSSFRGFALAKLCYISTLFHITDGSTYSMYMKNMGVYLQEQLSESEVVIVNTSKMKGKSGDIDRLVDTIKESGIKKVFTAESKTMLNELCSDKKFNVSLSGSSVNPLSLTAYILFVLSMVLLFVAVRLKGSAFGSFRDFTTVYMSILIQAIPFILIGIAISSFLQIFVSGESVARFFPKNRILAFCIALVSGVLIPLCDCAIVPVAGGLIKKGIPLSVAVTFMLAAPIVNPIVIASTFYAFPNEPLVGILRIGIGLLVALFTGLFFLFFDKSKSAYTGGDTLTLCDCGYCSIELEKGASLLKKADAFCAHSVAEFFSVGKFLIIGAFISALTQSALPENLFSSHNFPAVVTLIIMMGAAFVLSICSTSDAFIARSFTTRFPLPSVMGFLVLGPMIDIKNLLMLSALFTRKFVIKLLAVLLSLSFVFLFIAGVIFF
jgi:uncharacterized membrane protein YraQ (UPF0718 family)/GTPase SAR1 family protein